MRELSKSYWRIKGKISDSALWHEPLYQQKIKRGKWQHRNASKIRLIIITNRLRTVRWRNYSYPTGMLNLLTGTTFPFPITDYNRKDRYFKLVFFSKNIATGAASQQRTLTPPDNWSCPKRDLHVFKCRDQTLLNLSCFRTLCFEHPSVLLFCLKTWEKYLNRIGV